MRMITGTSKPVPNVAHHQARTKLPSIKKTVHAGLWCMGLIFTMAAPREAVSPTGRCLKIHLWPMFESQRKDSQLKPFHPKLS
jgi:hypothetical protein